MTDKPSRPPKPSQPLDPRLRWSIILGVLFFLTACAALSALVLASYNWLWAPRLGGTPQAALVTPLAPPQQPPAAGPTTSTTPTAFSIPTLTLSPAEAAALAPTEAEAPVAPECEQAYLFAAGRVFSIEILSPGEDGALQLPPEAPDAAYYVPGSGPAHRFILSDLPENLALLSSAQAGSTVNILWRGCLPEESTLLGVERADAEQPPASDPAAPGVTLIIAPSGSIVPSMPLTPTTAAPAQPSSPSAPSATAPPQPSATRAPTIPPPQGAIEAEIGFLGKQVTSSAITLTISVYNYGPNAFTLFSTDVLLLPPGSSPVSLSSSAPALPYPFPTGASQTFSFSFPNPGGSGIVFQIFTVEFDLDDF